MSAPPRAVPARVVFALVLSVAGVVLAAIGLGSGLTTPAAPPGFSSSVLLVVLFALPALTALGFLAAGKPAVAAGLLTGAGMLAFGQLITGAQLLAAPNATLRPELLREESLVILHPTAGSWLLLGGSVLAIIAGLMLIPLAGQENDREPDGSDSPQRITVQAVILGLVILGGFLLAAPFASADPRIPANTLLDRSALEAAGIVVLVLGVTLAPVLGAFARSRLFGAGMTFGAALGFAQFAVPQFVAGFAVDGLSPGGYQFVYLVCVLALLSIGIRGLRASRTEPKEQRGAELPGQRRLLVTAGISGLLAAVCAALATAVPVLDLPPMFAELDTTAHTILLPAAIVVALASLALLIPACAAWARPAFEVAAAALPLALAAAADGISTATSVVDLGIGVTGWVWLLVIALLAIVVAVIAAAFVGGIERDDVDMSRRSVNPLVLGTGILGFLAGLLGFAFPVLTGRDYLPAGLVTDFRISSWGMVLALLAVLVAVILAGYGRPQRAAALLTGSALVFVVRALEYPMGEGIVNAPAIGFGFWACLLAVLLFAVGALLSTVAAPVRGRVSSPA